MQHYGSLTNLKNYALFYNTVSAHVIQANVNGDNKFPL